MKARIKPHDKSYDMRIVVPYGPEFEWARNIYCSDIKKLNKYIFDACAAIGKDYEFINNIFDIVEASEGFKNSEKIDIMKKQIFLSFCFLYISSIQQNKTKFTFKALNETNGHGYILEINYHFNTDVMTHNVTIKTA